MNEAARIREAAGQETAGDVGDALHALVSRLFPICRSITGDGVRQTLAILADHAEMMVREVPSGTRVFDWTVPQEWTFRQAHVRSADGRTVIDAALSNLHLVGYSEPVARRMPLAELKAHLHTLPDQPDLIPYRTSYYSRNWGFCMRHADYLALEEGDYDVLVDTTLADGSLTYGEVFLPGTSDREVLLTAHICHPSLANDNCSGLALLAFLANALAGRSNRYGYRFLFAPGTIGALSWLAANEDRLDRIDHGLVVSCVGDGGGPIYKRSRRGNATIDRVMESVRCAGRTVTTVDFSPFGYDERQFCSPGFDLPVGLIQRSAFGTFPEYHTSGDNLEFVRPEHLASSFRMMMDVVEALEGDFVPLNLSPKGEPQLGRRGLYSATGGHKTTSDITMAYLWVLNLSDGTRSLLDIALRSGLPFRDLAEAAARLKGCGLLAEADGRAGDRV
jgi:aminopeptidase-like protein